MQALQRLFRHIIAPTALVCLPLGYAQDNSGEAFMVYDDGLKNSWQNWSWAQVSLEHPVANGKPIKVEGGPWESLLLHHASVPVSPLNVETRSRRCSQYTK